MNSGIYRIKIGRWVYYGQSARLHERLLDHRAMLEKGTHTNTILQSAYNKYGLLEMKVLAYCHESSLDKYEQVLLDAYWDCGKTCANIARDAEVPWRGCHHTEESKARIREAVSGNNNYWHSHPMPPEMKHKMRMAKLGKPRSPEAVAKQVDSRKGFRHSEKARLNMRAAATSKTPVICSNGKVYESQAEAARQLGIRQSDIAHVLMGRRHTTKGLSFSYQGVQE